MIRGLGIDVIETARVARALERHGRRLEERVWTPLEIADCAGRLDRLQALAARFAAKEACMKALGTGWAGGVGFQQIEIARLPGGRPELRLSGVAAARAREVGATRLHVSLTHQPGIAAAVVVLEG